MSAEKARTADNANPFEQLVGQGVDEVVFVRDYVQVRFDDYALLTCVSDPVVTRDGQSLQFPKAGSRDALCSLIGVDGSEQEYPRLDTAQFIAGEKIELAFTTGQVLTVSLVPSHPGWECAHLSVPPGEWWVW